MIITSPAKMEQLGRQLGTELKGGEVIELVGDIGAGKTTLTRGLAQGLGIKDNITSPSFTINYNYRGRNGLTLHHYDFYRLSDAGIIADELAETIHDHHAITVIEWGDSIKSVLPAEHITIKISHRADQGREVEITKVIDRAEA